MDDGTCTGAYEVDIVTVDDLCQRVGVKPTFLKVEAEGMEGEILEGMKTLRPRKIAVDASPEGGRHNRAIIVNRLRALHYEVRVDMNMVYGVNRTH
jgi:hypothetical protein